MAKLLQVTINGKQIQAYPLDAKPKKGVEPWYDGWLTLQEDEKILDTSKNQEDDLIFEGEDGNFYLLPAPTTDTEKVTFASVYAHYSALSPKKNQLKVARISPNYRKRMLEEEVDPGLGLGLNAPLLGDKNLADNKSPKPSKQAPKAKEEAFAPGEAKPGTFLTGAAAMAGGITLTNYLGDRFRDPNAFMGGDKLLGSFNMESAVTGAAVLPFVAMLATGAMTYAANVVAYMAENRGHFPRGKAHEKISNDSWKKGFQTGLGFSLIEIVRPVMEDILGKTIQEAWGTFSRSSGGVTEVIYPAIMLTVSLAVGMGMAAGSVIAQYVEKRSNPAAARKINYAEVFQAFLTGMAAGAVSTIDYGNKGISFFNTWLVLTLIPLIKVGASHVPLVRSRLGVASELTDTAKSLKAVKDTMSFSYMTARRGYNPIAQSDAVAGVSQIKIAGESVNPDKLTYTDSAVGYKKPESPRPGTPK